MKTVDQRPSSGSCARCRASLGLASAKRGDEWYCTSACAEGRPTGRERSSVVPEPWLYHRPRRFFQRRLPKELRCASSRCPSSRCPSSDSDAKREGSSS